MPTILGPSFDPLWIGTPPRMSAEDFDIFQHWRNINGRKIKTAYYDVGVGNGKPIPFRVDEATKKMWLRNTQKRIDMIAELESEIWIVEFRYQASSNAVGRLLMYGMLWLEDPVIKKPFKLRLITNDTDPDMARLCTISNIFYEQY